MVPYWPSGSRTLTSLVWLYLPTHITHYLVQIQFFLFYSPSCQAFNIAYAYCKIVLCFEALIVLTVKNKQAYDGSILYCYFDFKMFRPVV